MSAFKIPTHRWIAAALLTLASMGMSAQSTPVGRGLVGFQYDYDPAHKPAAGVLLRRVTPGMPADLAGLRPGDVILEADGTPADINSLSNYLRSLRPGTKVVLAYLRDGTRSTTTAVVGDRLEVCTRLAAADNPDAIGYLADMYWSGDLVGKDQSEALRLYKKAAELGQETAELRMAGFYYDGTLLQKDLGEAFRWARMAAEHGNTYAQLRVGGALLEGEGIPKDEIAAVGWFRRAAEKGDVGAFYDLGFCYWTGRGVTADPMQALSWFHKAADLHHAGAENYIGIAYASGKGVALDFAEAKRWYERAAEHGDAFAQNNLGYLYLNGKAGTTDPVEAYFWFQIARDYGYDKADNGPQLAVAKLTAAQMNATRARIADWESASLSLSTNAPSATVYLNNELRGTTDMLGHATIEKIRPGKYDLRISKAGYLDWAIEGLQLNKHLAQHFMPQLRLAAADLKVVTHPAGAQVYLNDEFRGVTGPDGTSLLTHVPAGTQKLRVSFAGYKDWAQPLELAAGAPITKEVVLEREGPAPLSSDEIVELLHGHVSNTRVKALVVQRGVDFELDAGREKAIRAAGGDSELLLAIATRRK